MLRTIWRRKASPVTSIVTSGPSLPDPDPVKGPDRLPVRRPEGARSRAGPRGPTRPRAIAAVSSGTRTPSAKRSRSGLRGPFQTV